MAIQAIRDQLDAAVEVLVGKINAEPVDLPDDFRLHQSRREASAIRNESHAYRNEFIDWLRINCVTDDQKTLIFNFALYPNSSYELPVMEAELIILKSRLFLLFGDMKHWNPADGNSDLESKLIHLKNKFPEFENVDELPDWAIPYFSENVLLCRPDDEELNKRGVQFVDQFLKLVEHIFADQNVARVSSSDRIDENNAKRESMCKTFREHGPSRKFLSAYFEPDWVDKYMSEYLYPY